jgi:BirA family biotin operon repressor/biotin-[acetyl-CoA-carboxylase] ligase
VDEFTVTAEEYALLKILADGKFYSGELLAGKQEITRAAIWKRIRKLNEIPGIAVQSVRGRGYQLTGGLNLLDSSNILSRISGAGVSRLQALDVFPSLMSTNDYLQEHADPSVGKAHACVAEIQTAGRGRRGKNWVSPFGNNVCLSLAWGFELPLGGLSGLSIAIGVSIAELLTAYGINAVGLKWPNDIHVDGKKLSGILVEARGEMDGPCHAIIGVGLNLDMGADDGKEIDQPWTDLASCVSPLPDRNMLIGDLINTLLDTCLRYQIQGLSAFLSTWNQYDIYKGRAVKLLMTQNTQEGIYVGLNEQGALILQQPQGITTWFSGEVSLRSGN